MNKFFSPTPIWQSSGLAMIRILVGIFMFYHGLEVFDPAKMKEYATWAPTKNFSFPLFLAYMGKIAELIGGLLLGLGLYTRLGILILIIPMLYIAFLIGNGKIWYDDQYPFLFVLLAMVFFFNGPGAWSIDKMRNKRK
ncbi:MAG: DoxX family protein [Chitinophagales bacterium]